MLNRRVNPGTANENKTTLTRTNELNSDRQLNPGATDTNMTTLTLILTLILTLTLTVQVKSAVDALKATDQLKKAGP